MQTVMKIHRLLFLFALTLSLTIRGISSAQDSGSAKGAYPEKPVHLIVPYPAGGGADFWGRIVAKKLSESLGQSVIVDNVPSAGGNKGTATAAAATPDGYTLLLGSTGPLTVHQFTYSKLAFDPERNFVPIALLESSPIVLVAAPTVRASSAKELIDFARANPGKLSYASNGNGSPEEVAGEVFKKRLKLDIRHLPYDGAGPARKAVLAGQASLMFDPCKGAISAIRRGLQKPLAVAAATRLPELPQVPTFGEIGVSQYELRIWTGIFAPAGTSKDIVAKLNQAVQDILKTPEVKKEIAQEGGMAGATTPEDFQTFIETEREHWKGLVMESGIPKVQSLIGHSQATSRGVERSAVEQEYQIACVES
jgi:tripartite-type tricarboxylate transporter receptor subunit TctC